MAIRGIRVLALALAVGAWLACGSESTSDATGASMRATPAASAGRAVDGNAPPRVTSVSLQPYDPQPGMRVQAFAQATDPDGDAVHIRYEWRVGGQRIVGGEGNSLVVPALRKGENLVVDAIASDGRAESAPMSAQVRIANRPPAVTSIRFDPTRDVKPGDTVVAVAEGSDPDGDPIEFRYEWRVGDTVLANTQARLDTSKLKRGDRITVRVTATDGDAESQPLESRSLTLGNSAPEIVSLPPATMGADGVFHYGVEAKDRDGDRNLRFRLGKAPEGAKIDPLLGDFVWKPDATQQGKHAIEVIVADGHGGEAKQTFEVEVREVVVKADATPPPAKAAP